MEKLFVDLPEHAYDIFFEKDFSSIGKALAGINAPKKLLIVTDSNVEPLWYPALLKELTHYDTSVCVLPAGEENKNMDSILRICTACYEHNMDRSSMILALGGGVVGDMAGFASAIYMRGIRFVQIPTTLLSQSDSSVGGKTGIDFLNGKNILGAFHQPALVYMNVSTLKTLPKREFISGMGEVIKHGMIRDADFFQYLSEHSEEIKQLDSDILIAMANRNCQIKAEVVCSDEKENGLRAILNFGHTVGHAIESACNFTYTHGECVALGMLAIVLIAEKRGIINQQLLPMLKDILTKFDFPLCVALPDYAKILSFLKKDKKNRAGSIKFVIPKKIGEVDFASDIQDCEIINALDFISK